MKMFQQYFLFVAVLFSGQLCSAENEFGYEYKPYQYVGGWLRLHKFPTTWEEARTRCYLEGGIVATPTNKQTMMKMMAEADPPVSAVFVGEPPSCFNDTWLNQQVLGDDDCLLMSDAGKLTIVNCSSTNTYFCYRNNVDSPLNHCGTWNNDYQLDPRTGSCYKFHTVPRSWYGAAMACRAEQAHLAVINSEVESKVLKELFDKHPRDNLSHTENSNYAHIGFWDWKENKEWLTIFGQTFEEAGFGTWDANEPNHGYPNEFCGSVYRNGLLNDIACHSKVAFICEITTKPFVPNNGAQF